MLVLCKTKVWWKSKVALNGYRHFIVYIKPENIYKDLVENFKTRFDTSNYELGRKLPKAKNKKVIELMKDELNAKTYSYLKDSGGEDKKNKIHKKVCQKSLNSKIIKTAKREINLGIK